MAEAHKIPAASIDGIDLNRISADSPAAADEIKRIGQLLDQGKDTDSDMVRLCDLLYEHGERTKSEELLRCNVVDMDDSIALAYRRLYGFAADQEFEASIMEFGEQFHLHLAPTRELGFLRREYTSLPTDKRAKTDPEIARFLATSCTVEFQYSSDGCTADIYSNSDDLPEEDYLLLRFTNGEWRQGT